MLKKIFALSLTLFLLQVNFVFAKNIKDNQMTREEIANKNLKELFNISLNDNTGNDKDMMDILQKYIFADIFSTGNLDIKKRELLTVTSLTVQQALPQLKAHINGALNVGTTPVEIHEAIYTCAPFIGFPKTLNALNVFNEVLKERGIEADFSNLKTVIENERHQKGQAIEAPLYGDEIRVMLKDLPNGVGSKVADYLTEVCFGDFYTRKGLDLRTRELVIISILTTTGNTNVLKSHIMGNLKIGNSKEEITCAIIQVMPYVGFANGFAALKTASDVFNSLNSNTSATSDKDKYAQTIMFPIGEPNNAYKQYFIGQSYLAPISTGQVKMFNVTFEPKCRNNWHIHKAKSGGGQILIAIGGRGYYQEWGKEPIEMNPGDVINIPANVKHWHGAAPDSWFSHIAVEVEGVETSNEWLEPVDDKQYNKLK